MDKVAPCDLGQLQGGILSPIDYFSKGIKSFVHLSFQGFFKKVRKCLLTLLSFFKFKLSFLANFLKS